MNVEAIFRYVDADEGRCVVSSITLPCKCGLGPERLVRVWDCGGGDRTKLLSRAFEPQADAGWPPPLASPVSFRRATQTYKAVRRAIQHSQASLRGACKALRRQPEDSRQVESAVLRFRPCRDRTQAAQIDSPISRGRGRRRCIPKAYAAAARRLPLCPAAHDPASDALVPSPVSATPRDLPLAASRRRSLRQTQIQGLSDRLLSYRHRRGSNCAGQAPTIVAIDRTSKLAFVEMHEKVARRTAGDFLRRLNAAVPYKVHTVLTDNGTHFTTPGNTGAPAAPDIKRRPGGWRARLGARLRIRLRPRTTSITG